MKSYTRLIVLVSLILLCSILLFTFVPTPQHRFIEARNGEASVEQGKLPTSSGPHEELPLGANAAPAANSGGFGLVESPEPREISDEVLLNRIAGSWGIKDPAAAMDWVRDNLNPEASERLLALIAAEIEKRDALADPIHEIRKVLMNAMDNFGEDSSEVAQVENLTQKWANHNFAAASDWVMQQPAGEIRDKLMKRIAFVLSETAPQEAASLVVEQMPAGELQTEAVISVVHKWGLQDPGAASAWVERFPEGVLKVRARGELPQGSDPIQ